MNRLIFISSVFGILTFSSCSDDAAGEDAGTQDARPGPTRRDAQSDGEVQGPCSGVTCSGHGRCVEKDGRATCECFGGYRAEGTECVCTPLTCDQLPVTCGTWREPWCGTWIDCGSCPSGKVCVGGGCVSPDQDLWTGWQEELDAGCQDVGWECGRYSNGYVARDCGACPGGAPCTWNGKCITDQDVMTMPDVFVPMDLATNMNFPYTTYGWLCLDEQLYDGVMYNESNQYWYWDLKPRTLEPGSVGHIVDVLTEFLCRAVSGRDNCMEEGRVATAPDWQADWCTSVQGYSGRAFFLGRLFVPPGLDTLKVGFAVDPNSSWLFFVQAGSGTTFDLTRAFPRGLLHYDAVRAALAGPESRDLEEDGVLAEILFRHHRAVYTMGDSAGGLALSRAALERFVDEIGGTWLYVTAIQSGNVTYSWGGEMTAPDLYPGVEYWVSATDTERQALYDQWRRSALFDQEGNPIVDDATALHVITGSCKDILPEEIVIPLPQPTATYTYEDFPRDTCPHLQF